MLKASSEELAATHHAALQLPTLWFAVLMIGHMLDTFVFQSSKRSNRAKWIWFGVLAGSVFFCFMWFRGMAFGITGPIKDHRGLKWRKVSRSWKLRATCRRSLIGQRAAIHNITTDMERESFPVLPLLGGATIDSFVLRQIYDDRD